MNMTSNYVFLIKNTNNIDFSGTTLSKIGFYFYIKMLKLIYFAYIQSNISFGLDIYGSTKRVNMDNSLKQQKAPLELHLS